MFDKLAEDIEKRYQQKLAAMTLANTIENMGGPGKTLYKGLSRTPNSLAIYHQNFGGKKTLANPRMYTANKNWYEIPEIDEILNLGNFNPNITNNSLFNSKKYTYLTPDLKSALHYTSTDNISLPDNRNVNAVSLGIGNYENIINAAKNNARNLASTQNIPYNEEAISNALNLTPHLANPSYEYVRALREGIKKKYGKDISIGDYLGRQLRKQGRIPPDSATNNSYELFVPTTALENNSNYDNFIVMSPTEKFRETGPDFYNNIKSNAKNFITATPQEYIDLQELLRGNNSPKNWGDILDFFNI